MKALQSLRVGFQVAALGLWKRFVDTEGITDQAIKPCGSYDFVALAKIENVFVDPEEALAFINEDE